MIFCVGMSITAIAQTSERPWGLILTGGKSVYNGDRGNAIFDFEQPYQGFGGVRLSRYLNKSFDLSLGGTYGRHGYWEEGNDFLSDMLHINLMAHYKLLKETSRIRPFINLGLGIANYTDVDNRADSDANLTIPVGIGAKLKLTERLDLFWMSNYGLNFGDTYDQIEADDNNDSHLNHELGFTILFGATMDTDGDGISDSKDACPMIAGVKELMGCPDTDGDGIKDSEDNCPSVAGPAAYNGCPDTDGDGILDKDDRCPNVAGVATGKGCPDSDGDGVVDSADECPNTKGPVRMNGCPDTDGDGIADAKDACPKVKGSAAANGCPDIDNDGIFDSEDECPNTFGLAKFKGCPDTDGDGIMDKNDNCPTVKGVASNKGCPEVTVETKKVFQEALRGINFETSRSIIKGNSYPILDKVVSVMRNNPDYKLSIEGHTDSQGDDAMNLKLSQDRAAAVKSYLVGKGIASNRMTSLGFGETRPVADNNTREGRAMNRRVEFKVKF